jgi:hypothetical protein
MVPELGDGFTKDYAKVAYTLWVRMMNQLSTVRAASAAFVKPQPLPFFSHNKQGWLRNFTQFDMVQRLSFDAALAKSTQSCKDGNPTIEYFECSARSVPSPTSKDCG